MSVLSGQSIRAAEILEPCLPRTREHGLTFGLGPAGYDLRLDLSGELGALCVSRWVQPGEFLLTASLEWFNMPISVLGRVCDKSTLARRGLSVFNTVIEPGWRGYLTLELVNHGREPILLQHGQGIAQVIFEKLDYPTEEPYPEDGKYQDQQRGPQGPR